MAQERVIIHIDMDAFFASVEQRDRPELRGKPVVVGADPKGGKGRGVVATASYEARRFGIHSAQPISQAWRCCPFAAFLPVDGEKYSRESARIRAVLEEFTPQLELSALMRAIWTSLAPCASSAASGGWPSASSNASRKRWV